MGDGASLRHSVFLGEANALCLPIEDLVLRLDLVRRWSIPDGRGPRGLYAFLDVFTGRRKSAGEYAELRTRGLRRVYVGVESGDDALLRFLNKPQRAEHALDLARTLELLNHLPLEAGDLVYLSAFPNHPHSDYGRAAREAGIRPLSAREVQAQITELRAARYDVEDFMY